MTQSAADGPRWQVVLNGEEQYSIWRVGRELPDGWRAEGTEGTKDECLHHIDEVWTDMRPLSLRERMRDQLEQGGHVSRN